MSSRPVTPTSRTRGCLACPGGENVTPKSAVRQISPVYGSVGRALGHKSLDAVRSVRGSLKGQRALKTATNAIPATSSSSCSSSPAGSATKQRWYDSIRSRTSQIPTPRSPASSSPTLKRRLFKNGADDEKLLTAPKCALHTSPTPLERSQRHVQAQTLRTPPPKLELPGLDADPRRNTTFRACSEKVIQDIGRKYGATTPSILPKSAPSSDTFASSAQSVRLRRAEGKIGNVSHEPKGSLAMKCDVHYPLIPSTPSRTESFQDTAVALSNCSLNNMLCGNPEYSNVRLWTLFTSVTSPSRVQQSFTVLPKYLKPDRNALGTTYQWAIIVFRHGPAPSRLPSSVRQHEALLHSAAERVVNMGYHIDVWTKSDNYCWREAKLQALGNENCQGPDQSLCEKYHAMVGHGIPGFSIEEIQLIEQMARIRTQHSDSQDSKTLCTEVGLQTQSDTEDDLGCRLDVDSQFGGFLEHQEESILSFGSETPFELHDHSHISGISEDLDMAARLGGKTFA
ncbi:hypothetical protein KVR01_004517 [Diaporthe batatas]|uniref:uncharacterized protein n=1 Tax=Diaporthe batatas TaxID=748121 RepID=UPI001D03C1ED|nr:uncharacterized protein KVR01_004517 [Diaporthe batatas]KAG8165965.1 hypothetical protein KVR01_004517 [Diaporthe batatas]